MIKFRTTYVCGCDAQTRYECGGICLEACGYERVTHFAHVALCNTTTGGASGAVDGYLFECNCDTISDGILRYQNRVVRMLREYDIEYLVVYTCSSDSFMLQAAVINACRRVGAHVTFMHYDDDARRFLPIHIDCEVMR